MKTIDEVLEYIEAESQRVYDFDKNEYKKDMRGDELEALTFYKNFLTWCKNK